MCCSFFSTPRLRCIHSHTDKWNQLDIMHNIKAVPYSENIEDLNIVKKIVAYYLGEIPKNPNFDNIFKSKSLNLLHNLNSTTDRRLKEIPYIHKAYRIKKLHTDFGKVEDSTSWIQMLTEARTGLNIADRDLRSLQKKNQAFQKNETLCVNRLKGLNELHTHTEHAFKRLAASENQDSASSLATNKDSTRESTAWDMEKIKATQSSIPQMHGEDLSNLLEQVRLQQTHAQKELLEIAEELKWLNRSLDFVNNNKTLWLDLKHKFEAKIDKFISPCVASTHDYALVHLDELNPDGTTTI